MGGTHPQGCGTRPDVRLLIESAHDLRRAIALLPIQARRKKSHAAISLSLRLRDRHGAQSDALDFGHNPWAAEAAQTERDLTSVAEGVVACGAKLRPRRSTSRRRPLSVVDVRAERLQVRLRGEAEVREGEDVLDAAQKRVVVIRRVVDGARLDKARDQE